MADSSIEAIKKKVRKLTRSPSVNLLSEADLKDYINTFILNDMPEEIRMFNYRTNLTFYTTPFVDNYFNNDMDIHSPLFDFKNKITGVYSPVYIGGQLSELTQRQEDFYAMYPKSSVTQDTGVYGNGTAGPFIGVINSKVLQNSVAFSCLDISGNPMILVDYPTRVNGALTAQLGALGQIDIPQTNPSPFGSIDYLTGEFTVVFPSATQVGAPITSSAIAYQPSLPTTILYFQNEFILRPVPDKVYPVEIQVDVLPTELDEVDNPNPEMHIYWQYIAFGAALKVLEDKLDLDSINLLKPLFLEQRNLVYRRTIAQYANRPMQTIFSANRRSGYNNPFFFNQ